ncbi:hypothetical protein ACFWFX_15925 [Streptomyces roseolus]|uniref:hypothetical protein n=1 Tax=Streptomyces roseolus TaxID=67358 RepID=UPI003662EE96
MTMPEQPLTQPNAAVINCRIRALLAAGELTAEGRAEYGRLLVEWDAAVQAEQELAA